MKIAYKAKSFSGAHLDLIGVSNSIIEQYQRQGYRLTLRHAAVDEYLDRERFERCCSIKG